MNSNTVCSIVVVVIVLLLFIHSFISLIATNDKMHLLLQIEKKSASLIVLTQNLVTVLVE